MYQLHNNIHIAFGTGVISGKRPENTNALNRKPLTQFQSHAGYSLNHATCSILLHNFLLSSTAKKSNYWVDKPNYKQEPKISF
jgi:hypothetical protein